MIPRPLLLLLLPRLAVALAGCHTLPSPGTALRDAQVVEGPVLIKRGERHYLRYRRAVQGEGLPLLLVLVAKKTRDAGYYYFTIAVSHPEWGNLIERPLAYDGMEDLAHAGRVFWLDPDGSRHPIPIQPEELPASSSSSRPP